MKSTLLIALAILFLIPLNSGAQGSHCIIGPNPIYTKTYIELDKWTKALQAEFSKSTKTKKQFKLICSASVDRSGALSNIRIHSKNALPELHLIAERLIKKHSPIPKISASIYRTRPMTFFLENKLYSVPKPARKEWRPKKVRSHCSGRPIQFPPVEWLATCERSIRSHGFDKEYKPVFTGEDLALSFKLLESGYVDDLKMTKKSNNETANNTALELFRKSLPLPVFRRVVGKTLILEMEYPRLQMKLKAKTPRINRSLPKDNSNDLNTIVPPGTYLHPDLLTY